MAKFSTIGYVGVPKKDPKKRYIKTNKGVTLIVKLASGEEIVLPEGSFISMLEPRKGEKQTDEQFQEQQKWKRFNLVIVENE